MKHTHFSYCVYSDTIRLWPQNYMIAIIQPDKTMLPDIDSAVPSRLATDIFKTMRDIRMEKNKQIIIAKLNLLVHEKNNSNTKENSGCTYQR